MNIATNAAHNNINVHIFRFLLFTNCFFPYSMWHRDTKQKCTKKKHSRQNITFLLSELIDTMNMSRWFSIEECTVELGCYNRHNGLPQSNCCDCCGVPFVLSKFTLNCDSFGHYYYQHYNWHNASFCWCERMSMSVLIQQQLLWASGQLSVCIILNTHPEYSTVRPWYRMSAIVCYFYYRY